MSALNTAGSFTLAKPWILPFIITSGLAAAWALPWSFGDAELLQISKVIVPLAVQSILSAFTAVFAFLGKPAWFGLLMGTFVLALINGLGFSVGLWGAQLPTTQNIGKPVKPCRKHCSTRSQRVRNSTRASPLRRTSAQLYLTNAGIR